MDSTHPFVAMSTQLLLLAVHFVFFLRCRHRRDTGVTGLFFGAGGREGPTGRPGSAGGHRREGLVIKIGRGEVGWMGGLPLLLRVRVLSSVLCCVVLWLGCCCCCCWPLLTAVVVVLGARVVSHFVLALVCDPVMPLSCKSMPRRFPSYPAVEYYNYTGWHPSNPHSCSTFPLFVTKTLSSPSRPTPRSAGTPRRR